MDEKNQNNPEDPDSPPTNADSDQSKTTPSSESEPPATPDRDQAEPDPTPVDDLVPPLSAEETAPPISPEETVPPPDSEETPPPPASEDAAPAPASADAAPAAAPAAADPPTSPEVTTSDDTADSAEFAALLAADAARQIPEPRPGEEVSGTLIQIGEVDSFVDCGGRHELPIATAELRLDDGSLPHKVGDTIKAHVHKSGDELRLTLSLKLRGQDIAVLERAFADRTPVEGTVKQTNKGGFTVDLAGMRAFCPFSQIDLYRVENPESFIGRKLPFRIIELSESGRNIVVSRRILLQEEREGIAAETRQNLGLGDVIEGKVTRLAPFGAFVDIGGLEGLVHISQISHRRVQDTASVLRVGQEIKVKVLEIQNLGEGRRERISLSMKALTDDPWPESAQELQVGSEVTGTVTRLTDFGAFVELKPGVEGLVHISELANRRILHPRDVVQEGQELPVRILDVDLNRRRISLSLKQSTQWEGD